ncbi:hypothetical protein [Allobaculum stercoricanis]|nr:hypothetical protein [Allobaculum stercoricanis]
MSKKKKAINQIELRNARLMTANLLLELAILVITLLKGCGD